jgi:hypothetical protein
MMESEGRDRGAGLGKGQAARRRLYERATLMRKAH